MNYHPNQQFGHPPHSPVSQAFAAAATSPGPVQDLSSYINSAASNSADGLGYTANSPQPSAFGHTMPVSANSFLAKKFQFSRIFPFSMPITFSSILHENMYENFWSLIIILSILIFGSHNLSKH